VEGISETETSRAGARIADRTVWPFFGPAVLSAVGAPRFGNALRRALLSSIEGAAITAVKIEGVVARVLFDPRCG